MSEQDTMEIYASSDAALMAALEHAISEWGDAHGLTRGDYANPEILRRVELAVDWLHAKYGSGSE
jgi:hypothetical protein